MSHPQQDDSQGNIRSNPLLSYSDSIYADSLRFQVHMLLEKKWGDQIITRCYPAPAVPNCTFGVNYYYYIIIIIIIINKTSTCQGFILRENFSISPGLEHAFIIACKETVIA